MDREKAARILDPETSRDALWEYEEEDRLEACNEACRVASAVLRAQPPKLDRNRWEGCKHCTPPWCGTCRKYDVRNTGYQCTTSCLDYSKHEPVNFCKNCGKPLTEQAWAELERRIGGPDETN